jgi:hypothetical protein
MFLEHCQGLDVGLFFGTDVLQRCNVISIVALILRVERNAAFNVRSREKKGMATQEAISKSSNCAGNFLSRGR